MRFLYGFIPFQALNTREGGGMAGAQQGLTSCQGQYHEIKEELL